MPETFTTTNERGREVDHERLTPDEETEAHLAAYEQTGGDANLVRLLRHLGSELMRVRNGGKDAHGAARESDEARKQRQDDERRAELQRQLDALNRDQPAAEAPAPVVAPTGTPAASPVNQYTGRRPDGSDA